MPVLNEDQYLERLDAELKSRTNGIETLEEPWTLKKDFKAGLDPDVTYATITLSSGIRYFELVLLDAGRGWELERITINGTTEKGLLKEFAAVAERTGYFYSTDKPEVGRGKNVKRYGRAIYSDKYCPTVTFANGVSEKGSYPPCVSAAPLEEAKPFIKAAYGIF